MSNKFYKTIDISMGSDKINIKANVVSFSGLTSYDYALSARYSFLMGIGLEAGYKTFYLESDDLTDNFKTDMDFSGPYLLAIWDF